MDLGYIDIVLGNKRQWNALAACTLDNERRARLRFVRCVRFSKETSEISREALNHKARVAARLVLHPVELDILGIDVTSGASLLRKLDARRLVKLVVQASIIPAAGYDTLFKILKQCASTLQSFTFSSESYSPTLMGYPHFALPRLTALRTIRIHAHHTHRELSFEQSILRAAKSKTINLTLKGGAADHSAPMARVLAAVRGNIVSLTVDIWHPEYTPHLPGLSDLCIDEFEGFANHLPATVITLTTRVKALFGFDDIPEACFVDFDASPLLGTLRLSDVRQIPHYLCTAKAMRLQSAIALCVEHNIVLLDANNQEIEPVFVDAQLRLAEIEDQNYEAMDTENESYCSSCDEDEEE